MHLPWFAIRYYHTHFSLMSLVLFILTQLLNKTWFLSSFNSFCVEISWVVCSILKWEWNQVVSFYHRVLRALNKTQSIEQRRNTNREKYSRFCLDIPTERISINCSLNTFYDFEINKKNEEHTSKPNAKFKTKKEHAQKTQCANAINTAILSLTSAR